MPSLSSPKLRSTGSSAATPFLFHESLRMAHGPNAPVPDHMSEDAVTPFGATARPEQVKPAPPVLEIRTVAIVPFSARCRFRFRLHCQGRKLE